MNSGYSSVKPSRYHANRTLKNCLVYDNLDKLLLKYFFKYKGIMYDFGCGETPYKSFFLRYVDQYIGIDWSQDYHPAKENIVADLNKPIPLDSELADTIVSLSVLEHLYRPQRMLDEAFRLLKPNGNIILQVPWNWWVHEAPHDYFRYTPYGLKYMFEQAGFKDIVIEPLGGFWTMWILKFNYFSSRFIRGPQPFRGILRACVVPIWYIGQLSAPLLDKLDKNWMVETVGFFVTAKK